MKTALIIGAGPAGLTAAFELLARTDIIPVIIEADSQVGGLSKTVDYKGNKIDIGGHRFFSKSTRVLDWWQNFLPVKAGVKGQNITIDYHNNTTGLQINRVAAPDDEQVMLVRKRKSRIYFRKRLFDYPLRLSFHTLKNLGLVKTLRVGFSYLKTKISKKRKEETLEDFFINRFGNELYITFFRDYTEKVWGVPCNQIPAAWGQQRVKDLDVGKLVMHAIRSSFITNKSLDQKGTSTSLIEQFLYPTYGPGQMWEAVAAEIMKRGGKILLNTEVAGLTGDGKANIHSASVRDLQSNELTAIQADYFFSTMPVKYLIDTLTGFPIPESVRDIATRLEYRDFLIVGLLAGQLLLTEKDSSPVSDNWIYIQDKGLHAGRVQFFHNWSIAMVADPAKKWIGVEYFCNESDQFWQMTNDQIIQHAIGEMHSIDILSPDKIEDAVVLRVRKAYPSYYGSYNQFSIMQEFLNRIENLFPIGRNGMHRYNNSDHSMLTAMTAVDNIIANRTDKTNIWEINLENEYHESDKK